MSRNIWKRIAVALAASACLAAIVPAAAQACSCLPDRDLRADLAKGTPAVIGEVVAAQAVEQPPPPDGQPQPPLDTTYAYTVRVERAFNGDLGAELAIVAGTNGSSCGIRLQVGQRIGTFLHRYAEQWRAGSCSVVGPAALIEAAEPITTGPPVTPPVPPTGENPEPSPPVPALRASRGSHVAQGGPRGGKALDRLPAKAGERVRLQLDAAARGVRFAFARANGKRLGSLRGATVVAGSRRTVWAARLPRAVPARADRLLVTVDYGAGRRATFAVGLGKPARAGAASALAGAGLPCPDLAAL